MLEEYPQQRHEVHVVAQSAAVAGIGGAMVAAEGAAESVDEYCRAFGGEPVVVAVGGVVATGHLLGISTLVVDALQHVDKGCRLAAVGVDDHQPILTSAEEVYVNQKLYLRQPNKRVVCKIMRTYKSRLLATEEEEYVCIVAALEVGHAGYVHHRGSAAGVVVGAVEDGVAVHAQVLIVGGEDNHRVRLAGDIAADVLRAVAGADNGWLCACLREAEILVVSIFNARIGTIFQRFHAVGHQLAPQVVRRYRISPVLHPAPEHLLAAEVTNDAACVCAVLRRHANRQDQSQ